MYVGAGFGHDYGLREKGCSEVLKDECHDCPDQGDAQNSQKGEAESITYLVWPFHLPFGTYSCLFLPSLP